MFSLQCGILVLLLILGQGGGVKKKPTSKDERAGRFPPTPPPTSPPRQWLFSPYHSSDSDDPRVVLDLPLASDPQVVWPRLRFCSTHTSTMIIVMYHRGLVYDVRQPSQHFWVVSTFDKTIPWHRADLSPLLAKRSLWTTEEQKKIRIDSEGREFQLVGRLLPISTVEVAHRYQVYLELNHFKEWTAEGLVSDRRPRNKLRFWVDNFSASIFRLLEFKDPTGLWRSGNTEYNIENLEYDETECVMVEADSACGCGKVVELDPHQSTAPHRLLGFAPGAVTRSMTRAFTAAARQTVDRMRKRELEMRIRTPAKRRKTTEKPQLAPTSRRRRPPPTPPPPGSQGQGPPSATLSAGGSDVRRSGGGGGGGGARTRSQGGLTDNLKRAATAIGLPLLDMGKFLFGRRVGCRPRIRSRRSVQLFQEGPNRVRGMVVRRERGLSRRRTRRFAPLFVAVAVVVSIFSVVQGVTYVKMVDQHQMTTEKMVKTVTIPICPALDHDVCQKICRGIKDRADYPWMPTEYRQAWQRGLDENTF